MKAPIALVVSWLVLDQLLLTSITRSEDLSSGFNDGSEEITL